MNKQLRLKLVSVMVLNALAAMAAQAEETPASATPPATPGKAEVVTTFGHGQTRQVQNISREDLAKVVPGTSALKTLEKLPGVSFQSADPFGAYEWSTRFSIRGFSQNQLGFTLDNVPLGDMSYGNHNGLHISRAISSENIGRVAVSQGAGSLATASTSNLGGTVQFFTLDPLDKGGFTLAQTIGSSNTRRTFVRGDTGVSEGGTKAYLSATRQRADKTKGWGSQNQDQFNGKVVHTFGGHRFSAFLNTSERHEMDYADMSIEMLGRLGYNWDNYAPDWQRAVNAAKGIFTGGANNLDDAYYLGEGLRKDTLGGATLSMTLSDAANLKVTTYHHDNKGQGHWYTPYPPSGYAFPIAIRSSEYAINRTGAIADFSYDLDNHAFTAGVWYEDSKHGLQRVFYAINGPQDTDKFLTDSFRTAFKQDFTTITKQYYLSDTVELMDEKLKVSFGFKSPKVTIKSVNIVVARAAGELATPSKMLPQFGANYSLSKNDDVFFSMAKNMRAYQPGVTGPFSTPQAAFDSTAGKLKPETSTSLDLGYRFKRDGMQGSVSFYHAAFSDRLLNVASCTGIAGCPSAFVNVGKVGTKGMESAIVLSLNREWSWFNSFTYNDSKYEEDYLDASSKTKNAAGAGVVYASGKQVVDSPKILFNSELSYETPQWWVRGGAKFTDKRYYTYLNDIEVPKYWVSNLAAGYRMKSLGFVRDASFQVNVTNLFNKQYFGTLGSNGFGNADPKGAFATLLTGAPRQLFFSLSGKI